MAIDTAAKRKSAMNVGLGMIRTGVIPDNANLEAPQRLHTQALYSGIAAAGAPAAGVGVGGGLSLTMGVG